MDRTSDLYKTVKAMIDDINIRKAKAVANDLPRDAAIRAAVTDMVDRVLERRLEIAMVRVNRKLAFEKVEGLWNVLSSHLIKIALWGDSTMWRKEIKSFAHAIDSIELKLKSRKKMTREELLDAMTDYRPSSLGRRYFLTSVDIIKDNFKTPPKRDFEEGRKIVYEIQMKLLDEFSTHKQIKMDTDRIIDEVLAKYTRLEYQR